MLITPLAQLQLSHQVNLLEATPDGKRIVVASSQGKILVLDEKFRTLFEYNIGYSIDNLAISPNGQTLALTNKNGQLLVIEIDGDILLNEISDNYKEMHCNVCLFSTNGNQLWNVVQIENNQVQIQYRETERWQVLKSAVLLNGNSYNYFSLTPHPENKVLAVWEAAGQDGCWMYWVWEDDVEIRVLEIPELENKIFPEIVGDRSICGNVSYFKRAGKNRIVSLHRRHEGIQDTLLLWGGNLLFGKCSQPSSMAPYTAQLIKR